MPCSGNPMPIQDCELGMWGKWSECNRDCDNGLRTRKRSIVTPATGGGVPCKGQLAMMGACSNGPCVRAVKRDARLSEWSEWSACGDKLLSLRDRKVAITSEGGGRKAEGSLKEIRTCDGAVDCIVSPWAKWDFCDKSCGGGQQHRHRQVTQNPRAGGKECPLDIVQTRGCSEEPCRKVDCEVSDWEAWRSCSASCGTGYQERKRS
eukprot:CAMPEP_0197688222 /NCGR_PEP_ID=MMETSP1338-20131121/105113_1 /TAXON_ID=43686 ORGANISM="Pelagodinium beii, Strain RCC1491" /NCGR_SAMPLE_ID=MMETSP1338 /ASSEMBLY_ACC=CAM_ASM_000754 /LENGTH=205 /DNA_ID=CAMNT_0043270409 /DNA_START=279 /DNA_END=893 /DNA_ORIENTATION=+